MDSSFSPSHSGEDAPSPSGAVAAPLAPALTPFIGQNAPEDRLFPPADRMGEAFIFEAEDGVKLRGGYFPAPNLPASRSPAHAPRARGVAIILQGRTEFIEKFHEVIAAFHQRGFHALTLDWRGQGGSVRLDEDPRLGHIGNFDEYRLDLAGLLRHPRARRLRGPRLVFAHSMGAAVALGALRDKELSGLLAARGVIFSAPMFDIRFGAGAERIARAVAWAAPKLGWERRYVRGCDAQSAPERGFENNMLTGDEARFNEFAALLKGAPHLALGGPSWGWLAAAFREIDALRASGREILDIPSLVVCGEHDMVIGNGAIEAFLNREPLAAGYMAQGAQHEPLMDRAEIREKIWARIDRFLADAAFLSPEAVKSVRTVQETRA